MRNIYIEMNETGVVRLVAPVGSADEHREAARFMEKLAPGVAALNRAARTIKQPEGE